jgi:hypothetical protein
MDKIIYTTIASHTETLIDASNVCLKLRIKFEFEFEI